MANSTLRGAILGALAGALALAAPLAPAAATIETPEAKEAAARAADRARADMRATFAKSSLKPGQYLWKDGRDRTQVSRVVIGLGDQMAYAYDGDELIGVSTISSGKETKPTPTGIFPILEKKRHHRSIKYDNAPMPYMQRLDQWGIALHAGKLPGYPASQGCVRLPSTFAAKLFASTRVGTEVLIGA
jgi:lipoprotein-anchoring transpeptidase ErfK/SrfK